MFYFVLTILLFIASVIVHISYCRHASKPGLHAKEFIFIVMIFLSVYMAVVLALTYAGMFGAHSLWGLPFRITSGIIFILLAPVYLCFYVLTQLTSPSKKILSSISLRGELTRKDILASVKKEDFIATRLNDLCVSGCVTQINGRYTLTSEGKKIATILNLMRSLLGRKAGG